MTESVSNLQSELTLYFEQHNPSLPTSLLLIHGAFSSGKEEWTCLIPYLSNYHLVVPDLPIHGQTLKQSPHLTLADSAAHLAHLVRLHAKDQRAAVAGFSAGAHVAIQLASSFPECVTAVVVSGWNKPRLNPSLIAHTFFSVAQIQGFVARLTRTPPSETVTNPTTLSTYQEVATFICNSAWPRPWAARTLIIAATRSGLLPVGDSVGDARRLAGIGKEGNEQTRAWKNDSLGHAWLHDELELFAQVVIGWVNGDEEMPGTFEVL